ncbi:TonB-dependent receptor [Myroides sp. ZB35]|uniref:TonB-dependent receptor n=1 Tax=Myroides sp. ZB35 TaxID=1458492 RepID=UPI000AF0D911
MILENQLNSMERIATTLNSQIYTDIKLMKDLTFSLKANLALNYTDVKEYQNSIVGSGANLKGRSYRNNNRGKTYSFQQLLNWKKDIGQHNIDVLFGHENLNVDSGNLNASKIEEIFTGIVDWSNFNKLYTANDFLTKYRTEGYFSRAKYNYANKYFLEASFRRDGSSKFHSDTRWGNFWSAGGSWIISSEDFFKIKQIDYLKLRASYGEVGDDSAAGLYAYYSLYRSVSNAGQPAVYRKQFGNKGLKWETSSSTNFAIDGRVFNRLNFTVEYFDKRSKNLSINDQKIFCLI